MHPSIIIYKSAVQQFISTDFEIETLADDCLFTEGPVYNEDGFYLFSDIPANVIYKITPGEKKEVFISNSGTDNIHNADLKPDQTGSNALAYDSDGELIVCQHGNHALAKYNGKEVKPYITSYNGRPLNSPNDLILHSNGELFFSDPPYGLKDGKLNPEKFQPLAGVYCWKDGELKLICDKYQYPNGVVFSPDEKTLYICSNKPFEKFVSAYDAATHTFKKIAAEETSDGIETDAFGNIYLCNKDGIIVLNEHGERLALIQLPTVPANICWGGKNRRDAFITARENIFLIKDFLR